MAKRTKTGWIPDYTSLANVATDAMNGIEYTLESKRDAGDGARQVRVTVIVERVKQEPPHE